MKGDYSLNLISEFSYKLHCKAGILASKYVAECPCFRKLRFAVSKPYTLLQFIQSEFLYLPLRTIRKKIDPRGKSSLQLLPSHLDHQFAICIDTTCVVHLTSLLWNSKCLKHTYSTTKGLILSSFQIAFGLHLLFQLQLSY